MNFQSNVIKQKNETVEQQNIFPAQVNEKCDCLWYLFK